MVAWIVAGCVSAVVVVGTFALLVLVVRAVSAETTFDEDEVDDDPTWSEDFRTT